MAVRHTMDGVICFTLREYYTLTRQKHHPVRIHFGYARPEHFLEYERIFKCPVKFNQPDTAIFLNKKHVLEPVISSDYQLLQILVQYAEKKLAGLQKEGGFLGVVKLSPE